MKVGIAGLGLIGGSFAKSYKKRSDAIIYGFDKDETILDFAIIYGAVDKKLCKENVSECDLILIALYPEDTVKYLTKMAPYFNKKTYVIDCCGIKREICKTGFEMSRRYGFTFAGGHPMAGTHNSGFRSSDADMFSGESMVIVPEEFDSIILLEKIKEFLAPADFRNISVTTAEKHDELIAFTSQMAHIISNAFIKSPTAAEHKGFSAGSYKDLTRVAWLNPSMWSELFIDNKDNVLKELNILINELCKYRDAIEIEDETQLCELLDEGRKKKEEVDA